MVGILRIVLLTLFLVPFAEISAAADRPAFWAQPVSVPGVPNLHQITPTLFRSAQPTEIGMQNLEDMGIRTVISLRHFTDDHPLIAGTRMRLVEVPIDTWAVDDEQVIETLRTVLREEDGPFLIHCQHGADRTGLMAAMYRIVVQHWSKNDALREMADGGYGFNRIWFNIPMFIHHANIGKLRRAIDAP